ncbi:hypothetical protein CcaverHIS631_0311540 [Cutaneotrichosporon cavernicola]|nr:hypothetical protein CcaverHIS631_0311540 [Cutaneotrichosporon cavernicola]BEJ06628.1 hypothetical protein CcaverHIS641_0311500 [Cutaneotrichosporon cavernicola]
MALDTSTLEAHLEDLTTDYYDLQFPSAFKLNEPPSALEALRMISKSHPTVIRGYSPLCEGVDHDWRMPATYTKLHGNMAEVTIAITDDGLADSVRTLGSGDTTFVKPLEERMSMATFLSKLTTTSDEALYLQSQDGNIYRSQPGMRNEPDLVSFQQVVERDVPWMRDAMGCTAEAVNLWIGNNRSTTSFHHDPYENVYHVLSGIKRFTLLSPIEGLCLEQHFHPPSTLVRGADGKLQPERDPEPAHPVPWVQSLIPPGEVRPLIVELEEGDTLYLPADWWHKVEQEEGSGGLAVAVNYWYTSELRPERYALLRFAQRVARSAGREGVLDPDAGMDDDNGDIDDVMFSDGSVTSGDEWDPAEWGR